MENRIINIEERNTFQKERKRLYHERIKLIQESIKKSIDGPGPSLKTFDYMIEFWFYTKTDFPVNILLAKLEYLENFYNKSYIQQIYMLKLMIEQKTLSPVIDCYSKEYLSMAREEIEYLEDKYINEKDLLTLNDILIKLFYKKDNLKILEMGEPKRISKQESDKIIDKKCKVQYIEIIRLLEHRIMILTENIKSGYYKDDKLAINSAELEIIDLKAEIKAKQEFIEQYKARKVVF
jgi:hypothetical protein